MSQLWAYNPDRCDGDYCPMNCDICWKAEPENEKEENEDD